MNLITAEPVTEGKVTFNPSVLACFPDLIPNIFNSGSVVVNPSYLTPTLADLSKSVKLYGLVSMETEKVPLLSVTVAPPPSIWTVTPGTGKYLSSYTIPFTVCESAIEVSKKKKTLIL